MSSFVYFGIQAAEKPGRSLQERQCRLRFERILGFAA
jgi:hypothetical protein